jgi:hypothetical protein
MAAEIDLLRQEADSLSSSRTIVVTRDGTTFRILDNVLEEQRTIDLSASPYYGRAAVVNLGGDGALTFNGYGSPDSGGLIDLRSGSYLCRITVDATTGACTIGKPSETR